MNEAINKLRLQRQRTLDALRRAMDNRNRVVTKADKKIKELQVKAIVINEEILKQLKDGTN